MVAGYIQAMLWAQIKDFSFTFWSMEITELRSFFLTSLHKHGTIEEIEHTVFRKDWSHMVFQPPFRKSSEIKSYSGMHICSTRIMPFYTGLHLVAKM